MTKATGSIGNITAYTNGNQIYLRMKNKTIPKRNENNKQISLGKIKALEVWKAATDTQRQKWNTWAKTVTRTDAIGGTKRMSGMNAFMSQFLISSKISSSTKQLIDNAPTQPGLIKRSEAFVQFVGDSKTHIQIVNNSDFRIFINIFRAVNEIPTHNTHRGAWRLYQRNSIKAKTQVTAKLIETIHNVSFNPVWATRVYYAKTIKNAANYVGTIRTTFLLDIQVRNDLHQQQILIDMGDETNGYAITVGKRDFYLHTNRKDGKGTITIPNMTYIGKRGIYIIEVNKVGSMLFYRTEYDNLQIGRTIHTPVYVINQAIGIADYDKPPSTLGFGVGTGQIAGTNTYQVFTGPVWMLAVYKNKTINDIINNESTTLKARIINTDNNHSEAQIMIT